MERICMQSSMKDIPLPSKETYMKLLIGKTNDFIRRVRWKIFYAEKGEMKKEIKDKNTEIKRLFKSNRNPPHNQLLEQFEKDLIEMMKKVRFTKFVHEKQEYLKKLDEKIKYLRNCSGLIVKADKTGNLYNVKEEEYKKLVNKELHRDYKTCERRKLDRINLKGKKIVQKYGLEDRTEPYRASQPKITMKDHKIGFGNKPTVRLINPSQSDIGRISKGILDRILPGLREYIRLEQWRNTDSVIGWFKGLENKDITKFIQIDIASYYTSIPQTILNSALIFAMNKSNLDREEVDTILTARGTIMEYGDRFWSRKGRLNEFDITIGSSDSAEVTDLVGVYLLDRLGDEFPILGGGLYRDDILLVVEGMSNSQVERLTKKIRKFFGRFGLSITTENSPKIANFLDVTLELETGKHRPYQKPNENLQYVNKNSNHPRSILKSIVKSVSSRITRLSADREIFEQNQEYYNSALERAGYSDKIEYMGVDEVDRGNNVDRGRSDGRRRISRMKGVNKGDTTERVNVGVLGAGGLVNGRKWKGRKKQRKRRIAWYNPPYNAQVSINVARKFLEILDRNFPKEHRYNRILNRHTVKVSYSTTPNMERIIAGMNGRKIRRTGEGGQQENRRMGRERVSLQRTSESDLTGSGVNEAVLETRQRYDRVQTDVGVNERTITNERGMSLVGSIGRGNGGDENTGRGATQQREGNTRIIGAGRIENSNDNDNENRIERRDGGETLLQGENEGITEIVGNENSYERVGRIDVSSHGMGELEGNNCRVNEMRMEVGQQQNEERTCVGGRGLIGMNEHGLQLGNSLEGWGSGGRGMQQREENTEGIGMIGYRESTDGMNETGGGGETQGERGRNEIGEAVRNWNSNEGVNVINYNEDTGGVTGGEELPAHIGSRGNSVEWQSNMGEMGVEQNEDVGVVENTAINRLNEGGNKCNCRRRDQCPLQNQCLLENVIYRGIVRTEGREYRYIGACSTKFKARWANHKHSFANSKLRNTTSIAKLVHELKDKGVEYKVSWEVIKCAKPYVGARRECEICVLEAYEIMKAKGNLLNRIEETIIRCRHKMKQTFKYYKGIGNIGDDTI